MERFGKYIMEYIDKNMLPFITGAIGVFVPGMLTIFLFNRTIFMKIDIIKLILLSISIGVPSFGWWTVTGCILSEHRDGNFYSEWQTACLFNFGTFALMLFIKSIYRNMTSTMFIIGIASICLCFFLISIWENKHMKD
nr:MAG TPA: hypothetical protein [Caudoviricetes sp.]